MAAAGGFEVIGSTVIHDGHFVTEMLQVRTPEGDVVERLLARHPGAVAVVAIHNGELVLIRQYRAPIDDLLLELPAGKLDVADEPPAECARRELVEEVGLEPRSLELLGSFVTAPGMTNEVIHVFVTDDCVEVPRAVDGVEEAHAEVVRVPVGEVAGLLEPGRLTDSKTLIGLGWAVRAGWFDAAT